MMEPLPQFDRVAYVAKMRQAMEAMLGPVADAINTAPDGHIIAASECQVRDLFATLRQRAFQTALQMRTAAAQAAFSPSEGARLGEEPAE